MLDSALVNSISSMPSPVYQWRKAFLLNMAVNCSEILLKISWMAVELPTKVAAMERPLGGMSQTAVFTLLGIQINKDGSRDELASAHQLLSARLRLGREAHRLVVVHLDPFHLELGCAGRLHWGRCRARQR